MWSVYFYTCMQLNSICTLLLFYIILCGWASLLRQQYDCPVYKNYASEISWWRFRSEAIQGHTVPLTAKALLWVGRGDWVCLYSHGCAEQLWVWCYFVFKDIHDLFIFLFFFFSLSVSKPAFGHRPSSSMPQQQLSQLQESKQSSNSQTSVTSSNSPSPIIVENVSPRHEASTIPRRWERGREGGREGGEVDGV